MSHPTENPSGVNLAPGSNPEPRTPNLEPASSLPEGLRDEIVTFLMPLDPEKVILFGSYAWGRPTESSDIDLFIVKKGDPQKVRTICLDAMRRLRPLIFKYKKGFDVLVDDPARIMGRVEQMHDQFYRMIQEKGVALYAK